MEKRRNCSLGAISPLFHNIFNKSLTSRVQLHIYLLNGVNRISFSPNSANLICRSTDISKYFRESLGSRDNESRLYIYLTVGTITYEPRGQKTYLRTLAPSKQSDQPAHSPSLIRIFIGCIFYSYGYKVQSCGERKL